MTNRRNIFSRFFRLLVMLHKISYAHFTEWNNKRKRKAFAAGIYFLSILPEFVLLAGTFLAARGQDGYVHLVNVPQKVVSTVWRVWRCCCQPSLWDFLTTRRYARKSGRNSVNVPVTGNEQ